MCPFKATSQLLQLLLSGMLLILILPSHVMTAPTRLARSTNASCPECGHTLTPLHRLLVGVEVLKTYEENISSRQGNTARQVSSDLMTFLDLVSKLEILHALTKNLSVDLNLSELIRQNVEDAREWLRFIDEDNATVILQAYLENITHTEFDTLGRIQGTLTGCDNLPPLAIHSTMWISSNSQDLSNINCSSLYGENECATGAANVTGGNCYICRECIPEWHYNIT